MGSTNKKVILLFILVLIVIIVFITIRPKHSSRIGVPNFINILATPAIYDNSLVTLSGYLNDYPKIYLSMELSNIGGSGGIFVHENLENNSILNSDCLNKYVKITGRFKISSKSKHHYDLLIKDVSTIFYMENKELVMCYSSNDLRLETLKKMKVKDKLEKYLEKEN